VWLVLMRDVKVLFAQQTSSGHQLYPRQNQAPRHILQAQAGHHEKGCNSLPISAAQSLTQDDTLQAYELSTLTGTQVLLLVASETGQSAPIKPHLTSTPDAHCTGHVYTYASDKFKQLISNTEGKNLIQQCLNAPDTVSVDAESASAPAHSQAPLPPVSTSFSFDEKDQVPANSHAHSYSRAGFSRACCKQAAAFSSHLFARTLVHRVLAHHVLTQPCLQTKVITFQHCTLAIRSFRHTVCLATFVYVAFPAHAASSAVAPAFSTPPNWSIPTALLSTPQIQSPLASQPKSDLSKTSRSTS
jgi:hypothetical protein